jgi:hypothetical protein
MEESEILVTTVIGVILAVLGLSALFFLLRNYRRQRDIERGPGIVPEDYD